MNKIKVDITKEFIKVVLEYYNNVYLAENKIFKHMSADALRMFDMNGYLVGYIFKDARCTDLPLIKTFSNVTVVNTSNEQDLENLQKDMNYFKKELGIDNNYTIYNNGR